MCRLDSASVKLPRKVTQLLVVEDLTVVEAEVVIGVNFISAFDSLSMKYDNGELVSVTFGQQDDACLAAVASNNYPSRYVQARCTDDGDVELVSDDVTAQWSAVNQVWTVSWRWVGDDAPAGTIGSGLGEYGRTKLSPSQEALFSKEVHGWIENGWLVEHDPEKHGEPKCVLPLLAQVQEHKPSTPVRPCLDYRPLNSLIISQPAEAPVCGETLRRWRQLGDASGYFLLDISKAYLRVHIAPHLQRYQTVVWNGKPYVMERMGFGLSVAPKAMDMIVKWVTRHHAGVDNYVDDLYVPKPLVGKVEQELKAYGLPTKPAEPATMSRVLGLQVAKPTDEAAQWSRRDVSLEVAADPTKREVFSWCGRVLAHYPVCNWLRPTCAYLKRLAQSSGVGWDEVVPNRVAKCCQEVRQRLKTGDPVHGVWHADPAIGSWTVWADASGLAIAAVLTQDGQVIEDGSWLRAKDDKRHINVAELEAAMKGIDLAVSWGVKSFRLVTDSKTVASWLRSVVDGTQRVRIGGLHESLVRLRLQIVGEIVSSYGLTVTIDWVKSEDNRADVLTRVPTSWPACCEESDEVIAAMPTSAVQPPLSRQSVRRVQQVDSEIPLLRAQLEAGEPITSAAFKRFQRQVGVRDDLLCISRMDAVEGEMVVPILPSNLVYEAIRVAHKNSGHGNWEVMWALLRKQCYFPRMAELCQEYVRQCRACRAANPAGRESQPASVVDMPKKPWEVIQIDTLELGPGQSSSYHCVLVCVDVFSKWVEVVPLVKHDGPSVAEAMVSICTHFGPPKVIRCDNGREFVNCIVTSLFDAFGADVRHGAVRHPQSQGGAERFNRTLLTLIRKVVNGSSDWQTELDMLLYYYRTRPHSVTGVSPALALMGWEPGCLIVESDSQLPSRWVENLAEKSARIRDLINDAFMASNDFSKDQPIAAYAEGDAVLLRRPPRSQKCLPPFETGWQINRVVSPSTVVIQKSTGGAEKAVNVDAIKLDIAANRAPIPVTVVNNDETEDDDERPGVQALPLVLPDADNNLGAPATEARRMSLRDRAVLRPPTRFVS